ncbi:hypothetical protein BO70DRAFT_354627 [Aspergillus heteromorphus CBS 117.55]|uniref:DNA/RNA-binding domain-containing protein n=1 Tax=Aspergillus heteromorphus CBS 117.55 TaxID=1448321 RepID=A0A317VML7_9EURO|nr:uncharacterized protein BO70DRAFT_354627 [Aspergillus heteromorphus CBS 117.55]PWY75165.1 hypothetical protein BO70DRAFT_354627 [Aspergillus heteromorphus CBS 117.55]
MSDGRGRDPLPYRHRDAEDGAEPHPIPKSPDAKSHSVSHKPPSPIVSGSSSPVGSSATNRALHSASASSSHRRGDSNGVVPDDLVSDDVSGQANERVPSSASKTRRRTWQEQKRRPGTPSTRPSNRAAPMGKASPTHSNSRLPRPSALADDDRANGTNGCPSPRHSQSPLSSPTSDDGPLPLEPSVSDMASLSRLSATSAEGLSYGQECARNCTVLLSSTTGRLIGTEGGIESHGTLVRHMEAYPIVTEEQLINDVRAIYGGIVMVEQRLSEQDGLMAAEPIPAPYDKYQATAYAHHIIIREHSDFFLASRHPIASPPIQSLAENYLMPARMWHYGIHALLELFRNRLPDSLEHMVTFIHFAYSMLTLMIETAATFEDTWFECLGDLSRYRMAIEQSDLRECDLWSGISRYWYTKAADRNPNVGRIQHHLAILARPDVIQQLFYYTKSVISIHPFAGTRESIFLLFNPFLNGPRPIHRLPLVSAFVAAHGCLYTGDSGDRFVEAVDTFSTLLSQSIGRIGPAFRMQGFYICASNAAAMLEYGNANAHLPPEFDESNASPSESLEEVYASAARNWTPTDDLQAVRAAFLAFRDSKSPSPQLFYGSLLSYHCLSMFLEQTGDRNIYAACHVALAFLWCLSLTPRGMNRVEATVPWRKLTIFLNSLFRSYIKPDIAENDKFPISEETTWVAEDFLIRGLAWSRRLYPASFFDDSPSADEGREIEPPSRDVARMYRCIWLGIRLAKFQRWMTYDFEAREFSATPFALELEKIAEEYSPFAKPDDMRPVQPNVNAHET